MSDISLEPSENLKKDELFSLDNLFSIPLDIKTSIIQTITNIKTNLIFLLYIIIIIYFCFTFVYLKIDYLILIN